MNNSLKRKLDALLERHEELRAMLSDNATISDQDKFRKYLNVQFGLLCNNTDISSVNSLSILTFLYASNILL